MIKSDYILQLIPKTEDYIQYIIELIVKIPRTEKFSIGTEYKNSMYRMLEYVLYLNKFKDKNYLNKIDTELTLQRAYLRIIKKNKWIDIKKFNISMDKIMELGKILRRFN